MRQKLIINELTPSSKTCHNCGWIKGDLRLQDREWTCDNCNEPVEAKDIQRLLDESVTPTERSMKQLQRLQDMTHIPKDEILEIAIGYVHTVYML